MGHVKVRKVTRQERHGEQALSGKSGYMNVWNV